MRFSPKEVNDFRGYRKNVIYDFVRRKVDDIVANLADFSLSNLVFLNAIFTEEPVGLRRMEEPIYFNHRFLFRENDVTTIPGSGDFHVDLFILDRNA